MELRQLEAFTAVAAELHFGRAAERMHMGQPALSELIQRLERELGTPLFTRTTRRVALTGAGSELLGRAKVILDETAAAKAAVRRIAAGDVGTVRVGITPPAAPVLVPYLRDALSAQSPGIELRIQRMWLPHLTRAIADGTIDVAITCGLVPDPDGVVGEVFCGEPLLAGLRPGHRLAGQPAVSLADLASDVLGMPSPDLFPAWALSLQQALAAARLTPPTVILDVADLTATAWTDQPGIDWILLINSLITPNTQGIIRPVTPQHLVPFGLHWNPEQAQTPAVAKFVRLALTTEPPPGWHTQPDHLRHQHEPA
jgi:DNA-binding transcriptional LysR family regulator